MCRGLWGKGSLLPGPRGVGPTDPRSRRNSHRPDAGRTRANLADPVSGAGESGAARGVTEGNPRRNARTHGARAVRGAGIGYRVDTPRSGPRGSTVGRPGYPGPHFGAGEAARSGQARPACDVSSAGCAAVPEPAEAPRTRSAAPRLVRANPA